MNELYTYLDKPDDAIANFNFGLFYENKKHYSPASTFYLRSAEKTNSLDLRYEVLIRTFSCYKSLGNRNHTCESLLKQAISLCPKKPEAYFFLCQLYESKSDWLNVYTYANIALNVCEDQSLFLHSVSYPGIYGLLFQKAASAWWVGKPSECRQLYRLLLNNYLDILPDHYKNILESNLSQLGCGPESNAIRTYNKNLVSKFKYPFKGIELIDTNFSQVYQDMFVLSVLKGKMNGSYLEIGSSEPYKNNNTALLENKFAWRGIGLEHSEDIVKTYRKHRHNPVICTDALIVDYNKLLNKYFPNETTIDYLQLDIDPPRNTYELLLSIPFDKYKFAVITYEHDYYVDITRSYRQKSREYLESLGYILLVNDVSPDPYSSFEDWWVHPDLIDKDILETLKNSTEKDINQVEKYFLNN